MWSANSGRSRKPNASISAFHRRRLRSVPFMRLEPAGRVAVHLAATPSQRFGEQGRHGGLDCGRVQRSSQSLDRPGGQAEALAGERIGPELAAAQDVKVGADGPGYGGRVPARLC